MSCSYWHQYLILSSGNSLWPPSTRSIPCDPRSLPLFILLILVFFLLICALKKHDGMYKGQAYSFLARKSSLSFSDIPTINTISFLFQCPTLCSFQFFLTSWEDFLESSLSTRSLVCLFSVSHPRNCFFCLLHLSKVRLASCAEALQHCSSDGNTPVFKLMFFSYQLHMVSEVILYQFCDCMVIASYTLQRRCQAQYQQLMSQIWKKHMAQLKAFFCLLKFGMCVYVSTFSLICWINIWNSALFFCIRKKVKGQIKMLILGYYLISNEDCNSLPAKNVPCAIRSKPWGITELLYWLLND